MFKEYHRGLIVGKFMPPHRGHEHLIIEATRYCSHLHILVYSNPDPAKFNSEIRKNLLKKIFGPDTFNDCILHFHWAEANDAPFDYADDYTQRETLKRYIQRSDSRIPYPDAVFTSEAYGPGFAAHLGVDHVMIDQERKRWPVSGTMVRENVYENFQWVSSPVEKFYRTDYIEKVVFLGAESAGKSTLSARMAEEYDTRYTVEVGRDECEGDKYHEIDSNGMAKIVRAQEAQEDGLIGSGVCKHYLFCDTNAITTLFYSYEYNNECHPDVWAAVARCKDRYDHVFVCDSDFPWEDDGTRRLGGPAHPLHHSMVLMQLDWLGIPYVLLSGSLEERVEKAKNYLDYHKQKNYFLPSYELMTRMEKNVAT
jgi:HTH-type transcriptional regulator, transcriptional repressor of NAD biosynthesis genes